MKIKSALKSDFCTFFFIYLVGMVIAIERTICRVLTNRDNLRNCFKSKMCFVKK